MSDIHDFIDSHAPAVTKLRRRIFATSRLLEFASVKELELQTGHPFQQWPLVIAKELGDNGIDACEEAGVVPDLTFVVSTTPGRSTITVTDNASGLPPETVAAILDFNVRVSSREAYVSPTRGAQGNALKTLIAMPFALDRDNAPATIIEARGIRHSITFSVDALQQRPIVTHDWKPCARKIGTLVTVQWPNSASSQLIAQKARFLQIVQSYAALNPHASFHLKWDRERFDWPVCDPNWTKWLPTNPTSAHWYDLPRFERLLAAHAYDRGDRSVREFISEFRGLSGTGKMSNVLAATDLGRVKLSELFDRDGKLNRNRIEGLLGKMRSSTKPVKPRDLGIVGRANFARRFEALGGDPDTFEYCCIRRIDDGGVPTVIEAAFALRPGHRSRMLVTGINYSAAIMNPFRQLGTDGEGLERILSGQRAESTEPIIVAVHLVSPVINYLDRGKSAIALRGEDTLRPQDGEVESEGYFLPEVDNPDDGSLAAAVITVVKTVTKRWAKQRKAEERDRTRFAQRGQALRRTRRITQRDAAWIVITEAYLKASANNMLPAHVRQIYYAARKQIEERTGRQLNSKYFTQVLLPDYIAEHTPVWADNVVYDDRGHLREPHTGRIVGLGTLNVRKYLNDSRPPQPVEAFETAIETHGPAGRFVGVLFVEKEGFEPLFRQVQLAERYDLALMSTKGQSVTAARQLADEMCAKHGIPLFILRDFDKSGFSIEAGFKKDSRRYTFRNDIEVINLGLRLADVRALGIEDQAERTFDRGNEESRRRNLAANGATAEEIEFLLHRRVELNALTSDQLVAFTERKLQEFGVRKLVPVKAVLEDAYRQFQRGVSIRKFVDAEIAKPSKARVPSDLTKRVQAYLTQHPEAPWDSAVAHIAGWK